MHQILCADDAVTAQLAFDDRVVGEGNARFVYFAEPALVDQFTHGLQVGVAICDVGVHALQHFHGCFVYFEEDTGVDLAEAEELEDLLGLGGDTVETTDTDNEDQLGLGLDVEAVSGLGSATKTDEIGFLLYFGEGGGCMVSGCVCVQEG